METLRKIPESEIDAYVAEAERGYERTASGRFVPVAPRGRGGAPALTDDEVRELRVRYDQGWPVPRLASEYNLSIGSIYRIIRRATYAKVPDVAPDEGTTADVLALYAHPRRRRETDAKKYEGIIVASAWCSLCGSRRGARCRVYQSPKPGRPGGTPEIGKERFPHERRVELARRLGVL
jgi:hypothetical protein